MSDLTDVPRVLEYVTVKRNLPLTWRSYGHWWVELDDSESYGWWPAKAAGIVRLVHGSDGVLNGGASRTVDPNHGLPGDHEFHPVLIRQRSDDDVRASIRSFAQSFAGEWRWSTRPSMNCRLFQLALFDSIGIVDGTGNYHTRGGGCPALAPVRRIEGRITGRRRWPRNLPEPGVRVADLGLSVRDRPDDPRASVRSATA